MMAMGAATLTTDDQAIERGISQIAERLRFVLDVTPVNVEEQRRSFLEHGGRTPLFRYRDLEDDPAVIEANLADVQIDRVENEPVRRLLEAKRQELSLQIEMLRARGSDRFRALSDELYGPVEPRLVAQADAILDRVAPEFAPADVTLDATRVAEHAERELAHYRRIDPDIGAHVEIRPDVAGVMVSGNILFVSTATQVRGERIDALLHHEVGTHLLTYINGSYQPIRMMATGLAGYEETQEGLAVLAEYLVGGLSPFRLRQLAARVIAVSQMTRGATFADVHQQIKRRGFSPHSAFTVAMRVFRSGGLTKDVIYLRGLLGVLDHLRNDGALDLLWAGKFALNQLDVIEELVARDILVRPRLTPRFLAQSGTEARLKAARTLTNLTDLMGAAS
jgi:uncharacterized protein (TIGR02421 family)